MLNNCSKKIGQIWQILASCGSQLCSVKSVNLNEDCDNFGEEYLQDHKRTPEAFLSSKICSWDKYTGCREYRAPPLPQRLEWYAGSTTLRKSLELIFCSTHEYFKTPEYELRTPSESGRTRTWLFRFRKRMEAGNLLKNDESKICEDSYGKLKNKFIVVRTIVLTLCRNGNQKISL